VAAVSNRVAMVTNGEKLQVLEHGRRFVRVQTAKGEQGWIDEKAVATEQVYAMFESLRQQHGRDPAVASAVVRDEVYLHARPGRDSERFYLLQEGAKLKMIERATLPKPASPGSRPAKVAVPAGKSGTVQAPPPPPVMEDWWLVDDGQGRMGWIYSRMIDIDAPDSLTRYAEGQRIVGAYVLTTVNDPDADQADKNIPIYVTVLSPYKAGLTYDFDQVRVFTWSMKKHRYETGFRDAKIEGYLPVTIAMAKDPYGKSPTASTPAPTFSYKVLAADAPEVIPDPVTGAVVPGKTVTKTYRLEGNYVRRLTQPGMPAAMDAHPAAPKKKPAPKTKGRKR
jgi:hypothetical protein